MLVYESAGWCIVYVFLMYLSYRYSASGLVYLNILLCAYIYYIVVPFIGMISSLHAFRFYSIIAVVQFAVI